MRFDKYIGIDWSGAEGECHKNIQVAEANRGAREVKLVLPDDSRGWSREAVKDYLFETANKGHRVLAGIDFAFAYPRNDGEAYFKGHDESPKTPQKLWKLIDDVGKAEGACHLYGKAMCLSRHFGKYYNHTKWNKERKKTEGVKGKCYDSKRRRYTEEMARKYHKITPSVTFNCVGGKQVGTGSLAGMRFLHDLKNEKNKNTKVAIWPFDTPKEDTPLTIVEIYPALYFKMACTSINRKDKEERVLDALKQGLDYFDANFNDTLLGLKSHDDIDALISAAALRYLHKKNENIFTLPDEARDNASLEGWILGVGLEKMFRYKDLDIRS